MFEVEMRHKSCPFMTRKEAPNTIFCRTILCSMWEEFKDSIYEYPEKQNISEKGNIIRCQPKVPAEGTCRLIPPKHECRYPG